MKFLEKLKIFPFNRLKRLFILVTFLGVLGFLILIPASSMAMPVKIVDDTGKTITLKEPAKRIIPLYGAFAEMLFSIGAGREVIARTQADIYPEEVSSTPW